MSEIRFRAWDGKQMRFFDLFDKPRDDWSVEQFMQYTGLKDWKKNEIWEGDIMRDPTNSVTGVVTWEEGAFFLKVPETGNRYILYMETRHFNGEVIGNICENKELLEK